MTATRFVIFSLGNDLGTGIVKAGLDLAPIYMVLLFIGMVRGPAQGTLGSAEMNEANSYPQIHRPLELTQ